MVPIIDNRTQEWLASTSMSSPAMGKKEEPHDESNNQNITNTCRLLMLFCSLWLISAAN